MLFAGSELAARIEGADSGFLRDCAEHVARRRPEQDVLVAPIAGGVATFTGEGSPLNKLTGLGFAGPGTVAELERVEHAFDARGCPLQVELSSLADASLAPMLSSRGYVLQGFENVLGLALPPVRALPRIEGIDVTLDDASNLDTWLDVIVDGFAHPETQGVPSHESFPREALERVIGDMAAADGVQRYLARRAGEPAGAGSLRLQDGVALLCGAATLPAHRRHGVQTALLATRLAHAAAHGCDVAVVTTRPGSKSQENVQRRGFALLYTRAILVRDVRQPAAR